MCRLAEWLAFYLPLRRWKDAARRRHLARCPRCAAEEASLESAVREFLTPAWTRDNPGFEANIRRRQDRAESARATEWTGTTGRGTGFKPRLRLQIAVGAALLFLAVGGWMLFRNRDGGLSSTGPSASLAAPGFGPRVRVFSAELRGKPAKTFIYQTPKISFVWISPSKEIGG